MADNAKSDAAKCPFPGMDPFLESRYSDLHTSMSTYARDALSAKLPEGLVARLEEYVILESEDDQTQHAVRPDVSTFELSAASATSAQSTAAVAEIAAAAPVLVFRHTEPETMRYIKVQESGSGRLITTIEYISPRNKVGREADLFRQKQTDLLEAGVNIVEIDLLRHGAWVVSAPEQAAPLEVRYPYRVCVVRAKRLRAAEMYRVGLRQPLPTIRIPLRPDDEDIPLNLQAIFETAYACGGYASTDYSKELYPPLSPDDEAWMEQILQEHGKRLPTHE